MNYNLVPGLKHIALVKVVTVMFNASDIRNNIKTLYLIPLKRGTLRNVLFPNSGESLIDSNMRTRISRLFLPETLKEEMLHCFKLVGLEVIKWVYNHVGYLKLDIDMPDEFCWTPMGTIDSKKTAEALIRDEKVDIAEQYKLACTYCLDKDVKVLLKKIPIGHVMYDENGTSCPYYFKFQEMAVLFIFDLMDVPRLGSTNEERFHGSICYQRAFEFSVLSGNIEAAEYFLQKLTPSKRKAALLNSIKELVKERRIYLKKGEGYFRNDYVDLLCFLLSLMNEGQQHIVFEMYAFEMLECFLDWPRQSCLLKTADCAIKFLQPKDCAFVLNIIARKAINYRDYNYTELFRGFWLKVPEVLKNHLIDDYEEMQELIFILLQIRDAGSISLIIKGTTGIDKLDLFAVCLPIVTSYEWLDFFIRQFKMSLEELIQFKNDSEKAFPEDMKLDFWQLLDKYIKRWIHERRKKYHYGQSLLGGFLFKFSNALFDFQNFWPHAV